MHTVIETQAYLRAAYEAGISDDEREDIVSAIAKNPESGESLGGGFYKVRVAGRGKGKSGGYRVITFYKSVRHPAFLITAFSKGEKSNLTKLELNQLMEMGKTLIESLAKKITKLRA